MNRLVSVLLLVLLAATLACQSATINNTEVCGIEGTRQFAGYTYYAGQRMIVRAAPSRGSTVWTDIGTATAGTTIAWTMHNRDGSTESFYAWDAGQLRIPANLWSIENGRRVTYVKTVVPPSAPGGNEFGLITFDNPNWLDCVTPYTQNGMRFQDAVLRCSSPERPIVRIFAPLESTCPCEGAQPVGGDVNLTSPVQLAGLRCVTDITGNLTVAASVDGARLPSLRSIGGDLNLDLTPLASGAPRVVDLPVLASIGDDVDIRASGVPASGTLAVNLPAMAAIGGDVSVTLTGGPVTLTGLSNVARVSGALGLDFSADTSAAGFLPALRGVDGNLSLVARGALSGVLPVLDTVGGNLSVSHTATAARTDTLDGFAALRTVGGSLSLSSTPWTAFTGATPAFGQLYNVGGVLRLLGTQLSGFELGKPDLSLGALTITDNPRMAAWPLRNVRLRGAGDLQVLSDAKLPTCRIEAFLDAQMTAGWTGTFTVDGTDDAAVCE